MLKQQVYHKSNVYDYTSSASYEQYLIETFNEWHGRHIIWVLHAYLRLFFQQYGITIDNAGFSI